MSNSADHVFQDSKTEVERAKKADSPSFLCLFLSRCLIGDKKKGFEELQLPIEQLQRTRFDRADSRRTPRGQHKKAAIIPKHAEPSHKECELVQRRDTLLREVLQQSPKSILPIANNAGIREKLRILYASRLS